MENQTKQVIEEHVLVKEIPMEFLENSYVGRVYLFFSPVRLVFTLDFASTSPEDRSDPIKHGFEFFSYESETDSLMDIHQELVYELCSGFMCNTEKEEQEVRDEAEEYAEDIEGFLESLVE